VRPLLGGYHAWKDLGYPVEEVEAPNDSETSGESLATEDIA
jgi:3-mercaptopyruvate sulfurtransferase SseA